MHLKPKADRVGVNPYLWMGSGFHYAMEECFGHKRFKHPVEAWEAYIESHPIIERPVNYEELNELCKDMLNYYYTWELQHGTWETLIIDGIPQVEVNFALELEDIYKEGSPLAFGGTIDRIVKDQNGLIWIADYKTAKAFDTDKLNLDTQVSAYCWAAEQYLDLPIEGMLYIQIHKSMPKPPKLTKTGVSTDKRMRTTYEMYKNALIEVYQTSENTPKANLEFLETLRKEQTRDGDKYVRVDWVERNQWSKINFYNHLNSMVREMISSDLPIYPNPTKDCAWDCSFKEVCLAKEEGADWEFFMDLYEHREETLDGEEPKWFTVVKEKYPERFK